MTSTGIVWVHCLILLGGKTGGIDLKVVVTNLPQINVLDKQALVKLGLTDLTGHFLQQMEGPKKLPLGQLTMESWVASIQSPTNSYARNFQIAYM